MIYRAVHDATISALVASGQARMKGKRDPTPPYMKDLQRRVGLTGQRLFDAIDGFMAKVRSNERR